MNTFFSSEMPAHTVWPTRAPTTEVSLSRRPYLPQTVRREQKERKQGRRERKEGRAGGREGGTEGREQPRVRKPQDCRWCQSRRVSLTVTHTLSPTHSWRTHLDLESQS